MCLGYRPDDLEGLKALCKTTNPNICTRFAGVNNKVIDIIRYLNPITKTKKHKQELCCGSKLVSKIKSVTSVQIRIIKSLLCH